MEHISTVFDDVCLQKTTVINTGIKKIDDTLGGYYPGEMTAICGDEDSCKTAFVIHQVCHIAIDHKIPVLLLLNNISERNFLSSMIAYYYGIEIDNVRSVLDLEKYKDIVNDFMGKLKESPLFIERAGWHEEETIIERISTCIDTKKIKILFVDETLMYIPIDERIILGRIRTLAKKKNIPMVVTCCVWDLIEEIEGVRNVLRGLGRYTFFYVPDIVIVLIDCEQLENYTNERSHELHGTIKVKIPKQRGKLKNTEFKMHKDYLLFRNYEQKQKDSLEEMRQTNEPGIDSLISRFDLSIENELTDMF